MTKEIKVLDHGYVKLIDSMGTDEGIIEAARMSTGRGFDGWEESYICEKCGYIPGVNSPEGMCTTNLLEVSTPENAPHAFKKRAGDKNLLDFLWRNKHATPFEMCELQIEVQAPIMVFREWHRHRTQCLAGDTEITCVTPKGTTFKRTIKEIFDLKHGGVVDGFPAKHRNGKSKAGTPVLRDARRKDKWRTRILPNCQNRLLRVLNTTSGEFETAPMADVWEAGVKPLWELTVAGGQKVQATVEHPFFTRRGWVKMKDIKVGDEVARMGKIAAHERPIPPALRSGIGVWTSMMRKRLISPIDNCYVCGGSFPYDLLQLDHMVPVNVDLAKALDVNNLRPACKSCHRIKTNTEQPSRVGMSKRGLRWERVEHLPLDLKRSEMTYDIEIEGPDHMHNYVANDLVVHNSFNEFSARYSVMPNLHYVPAEDRFIPKITTNKQASGTGNLGMDVILAKKHRHRTSEEQESVYETYESMLEDGVPKEVARLNTPVSRYSKMRAKTDLRNWLAFLNLRMRPNAQWEIRQYANAVAEIVKELWPRTYALFEEYDLHGVHLSRSEMEALRNMMSISPELVDKSTVKSVGVVMSDSRTSEFSRKLTVGGKEVL